MAMELLMAEGRKAAAFDSENATLFLFMETYRIWVATFGMEWDATAAIMAALRAVRAHRPSWEYTRIVLA